MAGDDAAAVRAVIDEFAAALHAKDARRAIATLTADCTDYDLAPPLVTTAAMTHDPAMLEGWFATWDGPISSVAGDMHVETSGDLAVAWCLRHLTGTKTDGEAQSLWFRVTAALRRENGEWKIAHMHNSVPFAMDGSGKALLDLKPEEMPR